MNTSLPSWVLDVICVLVFGLGVLIWFGIGDRNAFIGFLIVAAMIVLIIVAWRMAQDHKMKAWPTAQGRITSATARDHTEQFQGEPERTVTLPIITYTFNVGSKTYTGSRFDVLDDGRNHVQELLDKYKPGTAVPVFYNPRDPSDCVLQRGAPVGMWMGCLRALVMLAALGFMLHWLWVTGTDAWLRFRPGSNPKLMIFSGLFGLTILGAFIGSKPKVPDDFDELKNSNWFFLPVALAILAISIYVGRVFG
ncbi:MAG TPA: DUF3592 domain-containing protein [Rhizomicrobium sp.]|nr:DUF3592 domain-containing protein [Rhizomicrobium sp.]